MRFPLRRVLLGFTAGAAAGWVASLVRTPKAAPADSSAGAAAAMPVEDFGEPAAPEPAAPEPERPKPHKATPPAITHPPGSDHHDGSGEAEPATPPPATKPARKRAAPRKAADPAAAVTEAIGEGRGDLTERLADLESAATPPEPEQGPARRRRRPATE
jgi:hypothetical protein